MYLEKEKYAVIVAAGSGTRLGSSVPKQVLNLNGRPVLWWSLKAFNDFDPSVKIILVLSPEFSEMWSEMFDSLPLQDRIPHTVAFGGLTRTESVKNGLEKITNSESLVAIHDGARPLIDHDMIAKGWKTAEKYGNAVPVTPVVCSLRRVFASGDSLNVDRSEYVEVQTPQIFDTEIIKKAYYEINDQVFTDDASVVENCGVKIHLYEGKAINLKITNKGDIEVAGILLSLKNERIS